MPERPTRAGLATGLALAAVVAVLAAAAPAAAQDPPPGMQDALPQAAPAPAPAERPWPNDRILAVVGDALLLESEWRDQVAVLTEQLEAPPGTADWRRLARETYDQMLRDMIIVAAARRDTAIQIPEDRVLEEVDSELEQIRRRFPSEEEFQRQLRQSQWGSLAAYRADLQDRKREELLGEAFLERHRDDIRPLPVEDAEVRAAWEAGRASFGQRPVRVRFEEIPVAIAASDAARAAARAEADTVLAELQAGRDFESVARQRSDDPSGRRGGDLGWFTRGQMVAAFEQAAFDATPGVFVGPVETPYGWHVIQVMDHRGEEVRARHVLVAFQTDAEDRARARAEAEAIRTLVAAGADVDSLQAATAMAADSAGTAVLEFEPAQLPPAYRQALEGLAEGAAALVETPTGWSVVVGRGTSGGGAIEFAEIEDRLRRQIGQQKAEVEFVERLREDVYVDVRVPPEELTQG